MAAESSDNMIAASGRPRRASAWIAGLVALGLVAAHGYLIAHFFGGRDALSSPYPFLLNDHPFLYSNALAQARFLKDTGCSAGYDPRFMAGYANSFLNASNQVFGLVLAVAGEARAATVFNVTTMLLAAMGPVLLWLAAGLFGFSPWARVGLLLLWTWRFWSSDSPNYLLWGMVPFMASVAAGPLVLGLAARWLEGRAHRTIVVLAVTSAAAWWLHLTLPISIGIPIGAAYLFEYSRAGHRGIVALLLAALGVIALNAYWLAPGLPLWSTRGELSHFFINPNVGERVVDTLWTGRGIDPVLTVGAVAGVLFGRRVLSRTAWIALVAALAWTYFLAYPAGAFRRLDFLQPGRNTVHFYTLACFATAAAAVVMWRSGVVTRIAMILAAVVYSTHLASAFDACWTNFEAVTTSGDIVPNRIPAHVEQFLAAARREGPLGRRIFFEERNVGVPGFADPLGDIRLSPIAPALFGAEVIGGPWLASHYKTNFSQVGDGKFLGSDDWRRERFLEYATIYAADAIVCWSPAARDFCRRNPDVCQPIADVAGLLACRLVRPRAEWETQGVRIAARFNQITVMTPPGTRRVVLPYHLQPGLFVDPPTRLVGTRQGDDPVPFLTLEEPTERVVVRFQSWRGLELFLLGGGDASQNETLGVVGD